MLAALQIDVQEIGGQNCIVLQQDASLGRWGLWLRASTHACMHRPLWLSPHAYFKECAWFDLEMVSAAVLTGQCLHEQQLIPAAHRVQSIDSLQSLL